VASNLSGTNTIGTVSGAIANVNTTAGSIANVNTTAGSIANVNTVAGAIADVSAVATDIADVTAVADDLALGGSSLIGQAPGAASAAAASEIAAAASALAADGDADRAEAAAGYRVSIAYKTYAELAAITGTSGQSGAVFVDAGTHTDPVVGGTVDNEGVYRYSVSPAGWERVGAIDGITASSTDTFTNKTIDLTDNTLSGTLTEFNTALSDGDFASRAGTETLSGKTLTNPTIDGAITEEAYTITDGGSVDLNPANGTIQTWTLGASRSPTATSFANGQSMTLHVNDGTAYAITWPSVTWVGGTAPTLETTGETVVTLWKKGSTLYGALVGGVA
jgi:hypothetical protein